MRWRDRGGNPDDVYAIALWAVPAGLIGARLYHVVTDWRSYEGRWGDAVKIWEGGLGIPGGVALGVAVGVWVAYRRGMRIPVGLDAIIPGIPLAQAIGRLGNWWNQELFGRPERPPVGGRDLTGEGRGRRLPGSGHLPPHVPVRDALEPRSLRRAVCSSTAVGRCAPATCCRSTSGATSSVASGSRHCASTRRARSSGCASTSGCRSSASSVRWWCCWCGACAVVPTTRTARTATGTVGKHLLPMGPARPATIPRTRAVPTGSRWSDRARGGRRRAQRRSQGSPDRRGEVPRQLRVHPVGQPIEVAGAPHRSLQAVHRVVGREAPTAGLGWEQEDLAHVEGDAEQPHALELVRVGEQLRVVLGQPVGHRGVVRRQRLGLVVLGHVQVRVGAEPQQHVEIEVAAALPAPIRSRAGPRWSCRPRGCSRTCRSPWTRWWVSNGSRQAPVSRTICDGVVDQGPVDERSCPQARPTPSAAGS